MWPFIQVLIQRTNDHATFARSGYRGRLMIVTGQAVPPIMGMLVVMFLVNMRGLCFRVPSTSFNLSLSAFLCWINSIVNKLLIIGLSLFTVNRILSDTDLNLCKEKVFLVTHINIITSIFQQISPVLGLGVGYLLLGLVPFLLLSFNAFLIGGCFQAFYGVVGSYFLVKVVSISKRLYFFRLTF